MNLPAGRQGANERMAERLLTLYKSMCLTENMFGQKLVKEYQGKRDEIVMDLVRKYPLYSLDRLLTELPDFSRHSLQLILERHDLSTIEKRLAFARQKKNLAEFLGPLQERLILPAMKYFSRVEEARFPLPFKILGVLLLIFLSWQSFGFLSAKSPAIGLDQPLVGFTNMGEKLYVSGKVLPATSRIQVNGNDVLVNGDGTFTSIATIPVGESVLEVNASNWGKKAKLVRLVNRSLTPTEIAAKEVEEAKKKKETAEKMANIDKTVNDLLAARNANTEKKNIVKVLNSQVQEEAGFSNVAGEVINQGEQEVSWVMITATFLDQANGVVDKKFGFATDFGKVLKPNESAKFETQATTKAFDHYSLEVSWSEGAVAGVEASGSGKTE